MTSDCRCRLLPKACSHSTLILISISGACGENNVESDFIVALNAIQFGTGYPGPNCFKTITMKYNGKVATAKIMDMVYFFSRPHLRQQERSSDIVPRMPIRCTRPFAWSVPRVFCRRCWCHLRRVAFRRGERILWEERGWQ